MTPDLFLLVLSVIISAFWHPLRSKCISWQCFLTALENNCNGRRQTSDWHIFRRIDLSPWGPILCVQFCIPWDNLLSTTWWHSEGISSGSEMINLFSGIDMGVVSIQSASRTPPCRWGRPQPGPPPPSPSPCVTACPGNRICRVFTSFCTLPSYSHFSHSVSNSTSLSETAIPTQNIRREKNSKFVWFFYLLIMAFFSYINTIFNFHRMLPFLKNILNPGF